ncbi:MAG: hypothetical protein LBK02_02070 [Treponema sp.]|nr:hypothetical protein [Treponema sp.]
MPHFCSPFSGCKIIINSRCVGGNPAAAEYAGIRVNICYFSAFLMSGICAGIAMIIFPLLRRMIKTDRCYASFGGGSINVASSILSIFTLTPIENALIMLNIP